MSVASSEAPMNGHSEVERFIEELGHPLKEVMLGVRRVILEADGRVSESIKWKSPTFEYRGNIASMNPRAKQFVSLMFHTGRHIPGDHPALQGGGGTGGYMRFADADDLEQQRSDLEALIRDWCDWKDSA